MSKQISKTKPNRSSVPQPAGEHAGVMKHPLGGALLLVAVIIIAYLPMLLRGGFIWDDDDYVTRNLTLRSLHGLWRIWFEVGATPQYYPLVHTTFWVEYHLWGLNPLGYHLVNVLLHGLGSILLWRVLVKLQVPGAWLAASIWALHPVCVESVAWITERKNVLCGVFYFAAALAWLRFAQKSEVGSQKPEGGGRKAGSRSLTSDLRPLTSGLYWLSLFFFSCAMLSKTVACSLPAALLLVQWWKKGKLRPGDVLPLLPFFAVGIALGLLTAHIEKTHVGAEGVDWSLTFMQRCLIAGRALWFYAGKLVWPANLTFIYPRWEVIVTQLWQWLFPLAALGVVAGLWLMRQRWGRGPLVAVLFFAGTLFPALGFINVYPMRYSFVADHFQYLAAVGLITLMAAGLSRLPRAVGAVLLLGLGVMTWQQTYGYQNTEILWRDTLAKNPACWLAHNDLGLLLKQQGKMAEAETEYRAALAAKPDYEEALNNLAVILTESGRADEAIEKLRQIIRVKPNYMEVLHNLGYALAAKGQYAEAIDCYETVLRTHPQSSKTHFCLADALSDLGRADEAIQEYQLALQYKPDYADAHNNLGIVLAQQGKLDEAMGHFRAAIQDNPYHAIAHNSLGNIFVMRRQYQEAVPEYEAALRLKPDYAEAHNGLGYALAGLGRFAEAVPHYQETLRLNPGYPAARFNLGCALAKLGRREEAIAQLKEALRLKPDYTEAKQKLDELNAAAVP